LVKSETKVEWHLFTDMVYIKITRPMEAPQSGGLNARGVAKYSDFGPIVGYISETVRDRK